MRTLPTAVATLTVLALGLGLVQIREARACDPGPDYGPAEVVVETSGKRKRVKLNYRRQEHTFVGGHRNLAELQVFTKNPRLIKFLKAKGMGAALWKAVQKKASRATCATLLAGKRLARLERGLKATVAAHYRKKTRRWAGAFDLMLITEADQSGSTMCTPPTRKRR